MTDAARRALVADDDEVSSRLVTLFLRRLGWQSQVVVDGRAALQALREAPFDLVILDLRMPGLPGEKVCATLRRELGLTGLQVYAYTAHNLGVSTTWAREHGFDGLLFKPIVFDDVRRICEPLAARARP